jgi:hypothetical protein
MPGSVACQFCNKYLILLNILKCAPDTSIGVND